MGFSAESIVMPGPTTQYTTQYTNTLPIDLLRVGNLELGFGNGLRLVHVSYLT